MTTLVVDKAPATSVLRDDWGLALEDLEGAHRKNLELVRILKSVPSEMAAGEWCPGDCENTYESALESAHRSIEKCLTALGRLHLRRHLDIHQGVDAMAGKLRSTPSGSLVDATLDTLRTPENTAAHICAAANLLEHTLAVTVASVLRPIPIPVDAAATLNRYTEPIDYLRHHATAVTTSSPISVSRTKVAVPA